MARPATTYRRDALAIGVGVGVFGVTFGVLAGAAGLSVAQACVMSLLVFTGASQFAAVAVIDSGGGGPAALGTALLLAARNGLYGVAMSRVIRGRLVTRLLGAQWVIDETTAMASAQTNLPDARRAFWLTGVSVFGFWNAGTLLGAAGGGALGDPATLGLDAAFPAGFLALLAPHLRNRAGQVAAAVGAVISLVALPHTPAGAPILLASLAVVPALVVRRRMEQGTAPEDAGEAQA